MLYNPDLYGQNQKISHPFNWILIHLGETHESVIVEVNHNKENIEVINWHYLDENGVRKKERQAIEEGGLILTLESAAAVTHNSMSWDDKGTTNISNDQINSQENLGNTQNSENVMFSISPAEDAEYMEAVESGDIRFSVVPENHEETNILAESIREAERPDGEASGTVAGTVAWQEERVDVAERALGARRAFENVMMNIPKYREAGFEGETMTDFFKRFAAWREGKEKLESESERENREYERLFNAKMPYLPKYDKERMSAESIVKEFEGHISEEKVEALQKAVREARYSPWTNC